MLYKQVANAFSHRFLTFFFFILMPGRNVFGKLLTGLGSGKMVKMYYIGIGVPITVLRRTWQ